VKLGIMCSGEGTNFENIVHSCPDHEVVVMIHNKKECGAKRRAKYLEVPAIRIASKNEDLIVMTLKAMEVDLVVLAGWMKVLSPKFIESFPGRIINIHPSLLPKYKGLNVIKRAMEAGETVTGCTVHYVTEELDSGAIIKQQEVPILPDDSLESLTKSIQEAEHHLLPLVINSAF